MNLGGKRFATDKANGKLAGVCAGIGEHVGVDPTIVRIGFVLMALLGSFGLALIAYGLLAYVGQPRGRRGALPVRSGAREETREQMRDIDRRMQAIESYVASPNSSLAREIEKLR